MDQPTENQTPRDIGGRAMCLFSRDACDPLPDWPLGSKGRSLYEMARLGLAVPAGVVVSPVAGTRWIALRDLDPRIEAVLRRPVSVRCSAGAFVPGLMGTLLNLGLTDAHAESMARRIGPAAYALYHRAVAGFAVEVGGADATDLDDVPVSTDMDGISRLKALVARIARCPWPEDPDEQIALAVDTALASWTSPLAQRYRQTNNLAGLAPAAVIVQAMANSAGTGSGAGVAGTRDPLTGRRELHGWFAEDAITVAERQGGKGSRPLTHLKRGHPRVYGQLHAAGTALERHFRDAMEIDFAVDRGKLWLLGCRATSRSAAAAARIAVDMARQRLIKRSEAVLRIAPTALAKALYPGLDPRAGAAPLASGFAASPGAAVGRLAFSARSAEDRARAGQSIILARRETDPADIAAMRVCAGILTSSGGMTSHAAVVARGMGKPAVTGATGLLIDETGRRLAHGRRTFREGDWLSLDAGSGNVYAGRLPTTPGHLSGPMSTVLRWADELRTLRVWANADTPADARLARRLGAGGIGLCRTEHMFFSLRRIRLVRAMILAADAEGRRTALEKLLPHQRDDFTELFEVMRGMPVTIRLLDPPLHEFLPRDLADQRVLARDMKMSLPRIQRRIAQLAESNPMLGHRGVRLLISFPEILAMQVQAIVEAACICRKRRIDVRPAIMVPLVSAADELRYVAAMIRRVAEQAMSAQRVDIEYQIGAMIETPRAAITAGQIAAESEFLSFGTNDLTQLTFGFSRDDAGSFVPGYMDKRILPADPFQSLDEMGVGALMRHAVAAGRSARPGLKIGLCGEHGGEAASVEFCHRLGLDYVSCSPYRLPIARLAAAQAAVRNST